MHILVTYDVDTVNEKGQKRLRKVAHICKDYGLRVQNSVFECDVTEAQMTMLKNQLLGEIDLELDSIRIYYLNKNDNKRVITFGKNRNYNSESVLLL